MGIIKLIAKLIRLRLNHDGGLIGLTGLHVDVHHVDHEGKDVAFKRFSDSGAGDECVIVFNFANQQYSDYEFGLPAAGKWHRRVSTDRKQWSDDFGGNASGDINAIEEPYDGQSDRGRIELPPYTVLIYSQNAS